jgi:hypothetical protein
MNKTNVVTIFIMIIFFNFLFAKDLKFISIKQVSIEELKIKTDISELKQISGDLPDNIFVAKDGKQLYLRFDVFDSDDSDFIKEKRLDSYKNKYSSSAEINDLGIQFPTNNPQEDIKKYVEFLAAYGKPNSYYWEELLLRKQKSSKFNNNLYKLVYQEKITGLKAPYVVGCEQEDDYLVIKLRSLIGKTGDNDEPLSDYNDYILKKTKDSWELMLKKEYVGLRDYSKFDFNKSFNQKIKVNNDSLNLKVNKYSIFCRCYSRYALRLYNQDKYIWQDVENVYGVLQIYLFDLNKDHSEEIYIFRRGHNGLFLLIYNYNSEASNSS